LASARGGDLDTRAQAQTAYRSYLLREALRSIGPGAGERLLVGHLPTMEELEMSIEEEAGAILEAEMAHDLSLLRKYYESVHKE